MNSLVSKKIGTGHLVMDERIKQLADKIWAEEYWDNPNTDKLLPAQLSRFAKLIVRECLEQIDKIRDGCEADKEYQQALGADWAGLAVARHFGVEE
jgi:hypothetical protein